MGIRMFRQALALLVSLSVATPGWALQATRISASTPGGFANARSAETPQFSSVSREQTISGAYGVYTPQVDGCKTKRNEFENVCNAAEARVSVDIATTQMNGINIGDRAAQERAKASAFMLANEAALDTCLEAAKVVTAKCNEPLLPNPPTAEQDKVDFPKANTAREDELKKKDVFFKQYAIKRMNDRSTMAAGKKGMGDIWKYVAGAAVGAGAMYLLKGNGKKKESEEDKKAAAAKSANGVIKDSAGQEITCFSPEQVTNPTCKSTLLSLCQGEKSNTAGCRSFEAGYCAGEGNGSSYCLYAEAKVYCSQTGDMIAQSPACTWKSGRPASCNADPEAVSCLATGTPDALTLACGNYPNDPLCRANAAGRVVVQGGGSAPASGTMAGTDNPSNPGTTTGTSSPISYASGSNTSSASMSSVIGGARTPSNVTTLAVISPSENMWSSAGSAVKQACAAGQLLNCL